ncbi:hypothetical protein EMCG_05250 [[Emmonsia] crescens]|uniref:Uncharacterized protein n=1 Tax=[Emmonsia] crescens TaxID=73230 RepID=A0A0G2J6D3_9EURO|nr:hypothetical protein EMCG_05250 [Emmonsia crescens UAMH 3008]
MWDCSDSEPEEDDTMARRCSYCGRFGNSENIVEKTGLCHKCHENVHPSSSKASVISPTTSNIGNGPSSVAAAVMSQMATVDVNGDASSLGSITSIHSDQEDDDKGHSGRDGNGDGNKRENKEPNDQKLRGRSSNVSSNTEMEPELCARCWKNQSTTILYNTPICDDCHQIAQEKREHTKGTKKRFQPPTPHLQPGKRLTRVCDSCRRKRKRCQHRRVVDENDPEADFRRKRSRKERTSAAANNREGRSSTSSSSVVEVNDTVIVSETEQEPLAAPRARTTTTGTTTISTTPTNGATTVTTTASPGTSVAVNSESYSTTNLRRAIEESVHVVFSREMDKLVRTAEKKLADAAGALDDIRVHMTAWLENVRRGV